MHGFITGEDDKYVYVVPEIVFEVACLRVLEGGLREPRIKGLRLDKRPEDCVKQCVL